ncbi:MAG: phosphodiester glycosidase family protein [Bacteroidota bacterium]
MRLSSLFICLMTPLSFLFPQNGRGQACEKIKQQAAVILQEKKQAILKGKELTEVFNKEIAYLREYKIPVPSVVNDPFPVLSPSSAKYQDERGICSEKRGGRTVRWGTVKDLREYKRDSIRQRNNVLMDRMRLLKSIIEQHQQDLAIASPGFSPTKPGQAVKSKGLTASREIFQGKTYAYCTLNPKKADVRIATRKSAATPYDFAYLKDRAQLRGETLVMAMNGGMYMRDKQPQGLLIQDGKLVMPLNQGTGKGNFYLNPNGVFGVMNSGEPFLMTRDAFAQAGLAPNLVKAATQSGPMMLVNGQINPIFTPNSSNLHFRNAVGLKPNGKVIFAISEQKVNFYEFSEFLAQLGCVQALYLDGYVSRMYLPATNRVADLETSGHLGPILYVVE